MPDLMHDKAVEEQNKATLYVGGLAEAVKEETLHAAFIPFGEVVSIQLPIDGAIQNHRGFGFVEFEDPEDAAAAIDNMDGAEVMGRVLRVNLARNNKFGDKFKPVWANTDEYFKHVQQDKLKKKMEDKEQAQRVLNMAADLAKKPAGPNKAPETGGAVGGERRKKRKKGDGKSSVQRFYSGERKRPLTDRELSREWPTRH